MYSTVPNMKTKLLKQSKAKDFLSNKMTIEVQRTIILTHTKMKLKEHGKSKNVQR